MKWRRPMEEELERVLGCRARRVRAYPAHQYLSQPDVSSRLVAAMFPDALGFIRMLQLADSALPIGAAAHSFGIETLADAGALDPSQLADFLLAWLEESGTLEALWCLEAAAAFDTGCVAPWIDLNRTISAMKPARESRAASAVLGRRFLDLVAELAGVPLLHEFARAACDIHLAAVFGAAGRALSIAPETVAAACLHQSLAGLVSACQKLLPVGQRQASQLLWDLKPAILESVRRAAGAPLAAAACFMPAVEIASMRHPWLATRLFVS
jgi:urease accessory protein